jgi:carbon storage regulator
MLVLTRKVGEVIVIGNNICLTVVEIKGEKVRLGVTAPKEVIVDRQEIHEKRKTHLDFVAAPSVSLASVGGFEQTAAPTLAVSKAAD